MKDKGGVAARYFTSIQGALSGLDVFMQDARSTAHRHPLVAQVAAEYIALLKSNFASWENRASFMKGFRINQAESGFPLFQNVLELENDRQNASKTLSNLPDAETLRHEMADFILRQKKFPHDLQRDMAERLYLEAVQSGEVFKQHNLPKTIRLSVNPKNGRPFYVVQWAAYDGSNHMPMVYMATIEDSTENIVKALVRPDGQLSKMSAPTLPVDGLLNGELAHRFDDFAERNSSYSLTPTTIATNLDKDFDHLHPKQLRRIVLGPFWTEGVTQNNPVVSDILGRVVKAENAWLMSWTVQEVFSTSETPAKRGIWSSSPARENFHIETSDLEAARQGVSAYEKHALVPHDAYQALYASGEARTIFDGFKVHVIADGQVISDM